MQINSHNAFFREGGYYHRTRYRDHVTVPMDNAASLRMTEAYHLLTNVKSSRGDPITPSIILWGIVFSMWQSKDGGEPTAKVRQMTIAEQIIDTKPETIDSPTDDGLLRPYDNTSMGTVLENGDRKCAEY